MAYLLAPGLCPTVPLRMAIDGQGDTREVPRRGGRRGGRRRGAGLPGTDRPRPIALHMQRLLR
ncbi:hypothetical protein [Xanthomonas theicola]|uniref:hypothetical protein n=1 Tax=Xanthomonas theicola TaxID=56464 RepID=UPI0013048E36|nr:hypothetical protein [Xanthomonas theicola]QNH26633.1 hypothetical protein G4Q83_20590 [Xanthomonas theicola]